MYNKKTHPPERTFHPRVVNMTDIPFSEPEMALLQKGPKYNLHSKPKNWIQNLALEAQNDISPPPPLRTRGIQKTDGRTHQHLTKQQQTPTHNSQFKSRAIKFTKTKLRFHGAMITRADKGNSGNFTHSTV